MGRAEHTRSENNVLPGNIVLLPKLSANMVSLGDKVLKERKRKEIKVERGSEQGSRREHRKLGREEQQWKRRGKINNCQKLSQLKRSLNCKNSVTWKVCLVLLLKLFLENWGISCGMGAAILGDHRALLETYPSLSRPPDQRCVWFTSLHSSPESRGKKTKPEQ